MHEHTRLEHRLFAILLTFPEELDTLELPVSAFSTHDHQTFYSALHAAWKDARAVDFSVVAPVAAELGLKEDALLTIYSEAVVHDAMGRAQAIADQIHEHYSRRELMGVATMLYQAAQAPTESPQKAINNALTTFYHVLGGNGHDGIENAAEGLETMLEEMRQVRAGEREIDLLYTGYTDLDRVLGGLQRYALVYLAGRPGMGKSALAGSIAGSIAKRGGHVIFISREMSNKQQYYRWAAAKANVNAMKATDPRLMTDAEWSRVQQAVDDLKSAFADRMHIGSVNISPLKLEAMIRKYQRQCGRVEAVFIDRIELMESDKGLTEDYARITDISTSLKQVALDTGVPLVVMTQLNRKVEDRADKRPLLSDLRNTGSLEQDADVVINVYRDAYYNERSPMKHGAGEIAELIIAKNRDGGTGTVKLSFVPEFVRFGNLQTHD